MRCFSPSCRFCSALADAPQQKNAKVTLVYQHELPNVPGKSIKGVLVEYGPGGYSPGHTHPKSAFIYATVLEGAIRSQVNDGPVTTYEAGQSFSELPGDCSGSGNVYAFPGALGRCAVFDVPATRTPVANPPPRGDENCDFTTTAADLVATLSDIGRSLPAQCGRGCRR